MNIIKDEINNLNKDFQCLKIGGKRTHSNFKNNNNLFNPTSTDFSLEEEGIVKLDNNIIHKKINPKSNFLESVDSGYNNNNGNNTIEISDNSDEDDEYDQSLQSFSAEEEEEKDNSNIEIDFQDENVNIDNKKLESIKKFYANNSKINFTKCAEFKLEYEDGIII